MKVSEAGPPLSVVLSRTTHDALRAGLIRDGDAREHAAFLFAREVAERTVEVTDVRLLHAADFNFQSAHHLALVDDVLQEVILRAHQSGSVLIEAHSHPFAEGSHVGFSLSDEAGLREVVPHMVWRLPARPYAALVFGRAAFGGLYWSTTDTTPTGAVDLVVDRVRMVGSDESLRRWRGTLDGPIRQATTDLWR